MKRFRWMTPVFAMMLGFGGLSGCIFVVDDDGYREHAPRIHEGIDTYWFCEYDAASHDYYWEYQAEVSDADGLGDIQYVDITFYDAFTGDYVDQMDLFDEGGGIWAAWSWERETNLFCGEAYDVMLYVEDRDGNSDSLFVSDSAYAPTISGSPADTWADCYQDGHGWVFEFQTQVHDPDGQDDVDYVTVTFVDYFTGEEDGYYTLNHEGNGFWGGWIEEGNGNGLYCGDDYTVVFYAEDRSGLSDTLSYDWIGQ